MIANNLKFNWNQYFKTIDWLKFILLTIVLNGCLYEQNRSFGSYLIINFIMLFLTFIIYYNALYEQEQEIEQQKINKINMGNYLKVAKYLLINKEPIDIKMLSMKLIDMSFEDIKEALDYFNEQGFLEHGSDYERIILNEASKQIN